jgi:hypothetical protein
VDFTRSRPMEQRRKIISVTADFAWVARAQGHSLCIISTPDGVKAISRW